MDKLDENDVEDTKVDVESPEFVAAHTAMVPGIGAVEGVGGYVDLRALGDRASIQRAVEIAMMNDPPLAVIMTPEQRAAFDAETIVLNPGKPVEVIDDAKPDEVEIKMEGRLEAKVSDRTENGREVLELEGHDKYDRIVLVEG